MNQLLLLTIIVLTLAGCTTILPPSQPPPKTVTVDLPVPLTSVGIKEISNNVLTVNQDFLMDMSDEILFNYVTMLNWEMFRSYSTIRIVNQYATSRGWSSPDTTPICRYSRIPRLAEIKAFSDSGDKDAAALTESLMVYIHDIQAENEITKAVWDDNIRKLRFFCIY